MKILKFLFLLSLIFNTSLSQDSFELEIIMPKNVFITGELIEIGLNLKNFGNNVISFETINAYHINIINSEGKNLKYTGPTHIDIGTTIKKKEFKPDEEYYNIVDLNFIYGTRFSGPTVATYFEPDIYTIIITTVRLFMGNDTVSYYNIISYWEFYFFRFDFNIVTSTIILELHNESRSYGFFSNNQLHF